MVWVTSDTHFGNENIIKYCDRPFDGVGHQTQQLIQKWNAVVKPTDCVIHCGDFIMGCASNVSTMLAHLNGNIILVRGNHDTPAKIKIYQERFPHKVVVKDVHYCEHRGIYFVFNHFPLVNGEFGKMVAARHDSVVFVHGHVHNSCPFINDEHHAFNVCVDVTEFEPVSLTDLANIARERWKGRDN